MDLLIVGTSCKDMSKANPSTRGKAGTPVLSQTTSKGGSAATFRAFLDYMDNHRPLMILFENVDSMDDANAATGCSNRDVFLADAWLHVSGLA